MHINEQIKNFLWLISATMGWLFNQPWHEGLETQVKNNTKSDFSLALCIKYEQPISICQEFFAIFKNNFIIFDEILNKYMGSYVTKILFISS
jgi:hypothetical protein